MTDRLTAIPADLPGDEGRVGIAPAVVRSAALSHSDVSALEPLTLDRIDHIDRLRPFLVSVVSDVDLWMFCSANGALTAGRNNEDRAIFPYETDDKLHQHAGVTGPMTVLRVHASNQDRVAVWRPFFDRVSDGVQRSMSKSVLGERIVFEEQNDLLGLTFRYSWQACDAFGWVRTCELTSQGTHRVRVDILDGVVNLLPAHSDLSVQRGSSCLINAFAQCEVDLPSNLAIYSLASRITIAPNQARRCLRMSLSRSACRTRSGCCRRISWARFSKVVPSRMNIC